MKIGRTVPPHGVNGKLPGGIPIMRLHHKDGLNTDRTEKPVYSVNHLFICGMNLSKNLMQNFYRDYIGNSQRSLLSPTGCVKRIPPDTAIHEQNGYAKVYNDNNLIETNVDNDNSDTTHKHNMREVWARLHAVRCLVFFTHASHPHWLKAVHAFVTPSPYHPWWAFLSELLDFSFYLSPHFTVFFLSFLSMYSNNFDSVTNNLRNSANGTFVTSDDTFPLTHFLNCPSGNGSVDGNSGGQYDKYDTWIQGPPLALGAFYYESPFSPCVVGI